MATRWSSLAQQSEWWLALVELRHFSIVNMVFDIDDTVHILIRLDMNLWVSNTREQVTIAGIQYLNHVRFHTYD